MGFITKKTDIRIECYSRSPYFGRDDRTEKEIIDDCEEIVRQIKRHADAVGARVIWDNEIICEHCNLPWTEGKNSLHNGGCCKKDCEVMEAVEFAQEFNNDTNNE